MKRAAAFRDRLDYKDGVSESELRKLHEKFRNFAQEERSEQSWPEVEREISNHFGSFGAFENAVINYLCGYDIDLQRSRLSGFDFAITNRVLDIRQRAPPAQRELPGCPRQPSRAFLRVLLHVRKHYDKNNQTLSEISFRLQEAVIADCTTTEELQSAWTRICVAAGGILDFIAEGFSTNSIQLLWADNTDPFLPSNSDLSIDGGIVRCAAAGKRLTSIIIKASAQSHGVTLKDHEVRWEFPTANPWTTALLAITDGQLNPANRGHQELIPILPICCSSKVPELVEISTEDEFVAALSDINVKFTDLLTSIRQGLSSEQEVLRYAEAVALCFQQFVTDVLTRGFFSSIARADSSGLELNKAFKTLLKHLSETRWSSQVQQKLNPLANSFLIAPPQEGIESIGLSCALVPPFHPAMLEKIQDQAQFVRDGALELLDQVHDSGIRIDDAIRHLFELSTITSGLDVIPGKHHPQCLRSTNTFAYHSLYRSEVRREVILSTITDKSLDVVEEDHGSLTDMRKEGPLSRLIADQLNQYLSVFPWHHDEFTLVFINPSDLQPIVAAVSVFVDELKKSFSNDLEARTRVNVYVFVESLAKGGLGYLRFWLDDLLDEDDPIELRIYCTTFAPRNLTDPKYLEELLPVADVAFVNDFLREC